MNKNITYIILENNVLISKKEYSDWRAIQDEYFDNYVTSMGPWTVDEFLEYLKDDFKDESNWPFNTQDILEFIATDNIILWGKK